MTGYDALNSYGYNSVTAISGYWRIPRRLASEFKKAVGTPGAGARLLDFGCGTGRLTQAFRKLQPALHITGMDPSPYMSELYQKKFSGNANIEFTRDGWDDGLKRVADKSADIVASSGVFDHLRINSDMMREFMRVIRPGGFFAFTYERHCGDADNYKTLLDRVSHSDKHVRQAVEAAGGTILYHGKMLGYVIPTPALTGIVIAQKSPFLSAA